MQKRTTVNIPEETIETLKFLAQELNFTQSEVIQYAFAIIDQLQEFLEDVLKKADDNKLDLKKHSMVLDSSLIKSLDLKTKMYGCSRTSIIWTAIKMAESLYSMRKKRRYEIALELKEDADQIFELHRSFSRRVASLFEDYDDDGIINELEYSRHHLDEAIGGIYSIINSYEKLKKEFSNED